MAEKKTAKINVSEIRKITKSKEAVIGTKEVLKNLKLGRISKLYLTSNCPEDIREKTLHYAKSGKASVFNLDIPNDELGIICKKPYSISVMALLKGEK